MLRHFWITLLLLCATYIAAVRADPREVESAEFKDDFGDDYDDRLSPAADLDQRLEFELEHNLPSASSSFTARGKVEIVFSSSSPKPKVTFSGLPVLGAHEIAQLEKLLRNGKHYTLRARSDPSNPASPYVMTSIPMCQLAGTRMREDLTFHLSDNGKLIAIEYLTPYVSAATCAEFMTRDLKSAKLTSQGSALKPQNGPTPPKQVTKPKKAPKGVKNPVKTEEGAQGEEESQSLLRRYWYIILPIVVMGLFGGDSGPAPAAGAAGGAPAAGAGGARRR